MRLRLVAGMVGAALLALGTPSVTAAADPGPGAGVVAQAVRAAEHGPGTAPHAVPPEATPSPRPPASPSPTYDPALRVAIARWVTGGGENDLATLGVDFTVLEHAASASDLPAMGAGCRRLGIDVRAAQRHAPIPDARAEHYWAAALARYARGAADCVAGTRANDTILMMEASDEIIAGSDDIEQVTNRLNQIG